MDEMKGDEVLEVLGKPRRAPMGRRDSNPYAGEFIPKHLHFRRRESNFGQVATKVNQRTYFDANVAFCMQLVLLVLTNVCYTGALGGTAWESFTEMNHRVEKPRGPGGHEYNLTDDTLSTWFSEKEEKIQFDVWPYEQEVDGTLQHTTGKNFVSRPDLYGKRGSCYHPKNPESPEDFGVVLRYFGQQFDYKYKYNATLDAWYVDGVKYDMQPCQDLQISYILGATACSLSFFAFFFALVFMVLTYCVDPHWADGKFDLVCVDTAPAKLHGIRRFEPGKILKKYVMGFGRVFVVMFATIVCNVHVIMGYATAATSFLKAGAGAASAAAMARFHGNWWSFQWPWYVMGFLCLFDLLATTRFVNVTRGYFQMRRKIMLQNVPEGLWGRKVRCGGTEGFLAENKLGIEFVKVGHEIQVKSVTGFSKTKGALTNVERELGVPEYYASNVQKGDVFLGIMQVKDVVINQEKSEDRAEEDARMLSYLDPDNPLQFRKDKDVPEENRGNHIEEEVYLSWKSTKFRTQIKNKEVYTWITPHIDATLEDAERLINQAKDEACPVNDRGEKLEENPYWLIMWRVNSEGFKKVNHPVPMSCTETEFSKIEYQQRNLLVRYELLGPFVPNLGLDLFDLHKTQNEYGHKEVEALVILGASEPGESMNLQEDDLIVGLNYIPLTKDIIARKFFEILHQMPMPYVLNTCKKVKTYDASHELAKDLDPLRFHKTLVLFTMLFIGFMFAVVATGATEWTVKDPSMRRTSNYGIGIWYASVNVRMEEGVDPVPNLNRVDALMDQLVWSDEYLTWRGNKFKLATRGFTFLATIFGFLGSATVGVLLMIGVQMVSKTNFNRYIGIACVCSVMQALSALVATLLWIYVHHELQGMTDNCVAQYDDPRGVHVIEMAKKAVHDADLYGPKICLEDFQAGPAWIMLAFSSFVGLIMSLDSFLAFTVYSDSRTKKQLQEIEVAKRRAEVAHMKFVDPDSSEF